MASEYAHLLSYTADAIHALGDSRLKVNSTVFRRRRFGLSAGEVAAAGLAPGGNIQCGCCGSPSCPNDQGGVTGKISHAMRF
jgi:hypothetical protein